MTIRCLDCQMENPPPERTCTGGGHHFVSMDSPAGCPYCGRLKAVCDEQSACSGALTALTQPDGAGTDGEDLRRR